jgi:hypothetical protein
MIFYLEAKIPIKTNQTKHNFDKTKHLLQRDKIMEYGRNLRLKLARKIKPITLPVDNRLTRAFSIIKHKIDRTKDPKIDSKRFPELYLLTRALQIDIKGIYIWWLFIVFPKTSNWTVKDMDLDSRAYHLYDYHRKYSSAERVKPKKDDTRLLQLRIIDTAPKPTIMSEGTKLTKYLKQLQAKIYNTDVQYELNMHLGNILVFDVYSEYG